jgi:hypothetical protein
LKELRRREVLEKQRKGCKVVSHPIRYMATRRDVVADKQLQQHLILSVHTLMSNADAGHDVVEAGGSSM